jgi:hypothetical protein
MALCAGLVCAAFAADRARSRLVRHAAKKSLTVEWDGPLPTDAASWSQIVAALSRSGRG